ncbi:MAG: hypothetical protein H6850_03185 [Alphaproteobacteria bacterium]|nr:MAG: hypothetical protein H6850_03185 [Alphaproteobacteria bacterium]
MMFFVLFFLLTLFLLLSVKVGENIVDIKTFSTTSLGSFSFICNVTSSFIGGIFILGNIENGFYYGISPLIGFLGFPFQLLLVGLMISPRRIKALTVGEMCELYYGKYFRIFMGLVVTIFNLSVITAMIYSMSLALTSFGPIAVVSTVICSLIFLLCCCYGGVITAVYLGVLQFLIMLLGVLIGTLVVIFCCEGVGGFFAAIPSGHFHFPDGHSYAKIFSIFIGFSLGNALMPPVLQTINLAQTKGQARSGYLMASFFIALFALFFTLCGMGFAAFNVGSLGDLFKNAFLLMPFWLKVFAAFGLLIAALSSVDTFLNIASTAFVKDVVKFLDSEVDELKAVRLCVFVFGFICLFPVLFISSDLFDVLFFIYKFWGPLLAAVLIGIHFKKPIQIKHFWVISFLTLCAMGLWNILGLEGKTDISDLVIGLGVNFLLYGLARGTQRQTQV